MTSQLDKIEIQLTRIEQRLELLRMKISINRDFQVLGHLTETTRRYEKLTDLLRQELKLV